MLCWSLTFETCSFLLFFFCTILCSIVSLNCLVWIIIIVIITIVYETKIFVHHLISFYLAHVGSIIKIITIILQLIVNFFSLLFFEFHQYWMLNQLLIEDSLSYIYTVFFLVLNEHQLIVSIFVFHCYNTNHFFYFHTRNRADICDSLVTNSWNKMAT